jgi:hypothetical protein
LYTGPRRFGKGTISRPAASDKGQWFLSPLLLTSTWTTTFVTTLFSRPEEADNLIVLLRIPHTFTDMSAAPVADSGGARPHRTQSTSARHAAQPSQGGRSHAQSYRPSGDPQALANVARRDGEQSNLAQSSSQPRSASRDGGSSSHHPARSDSVRTGTQSGSRSDRARYTSTDATSQSPGTNGMPPDHTSGRHPGTSSGNRKRAYITCSTGSWQLGKTIGAGSMGKVKLARNQETGEQVGSFLPCCVSTYG